jgi:WD40 repeat protein
MRRLLLTPVVLVTLLASLSSTAQEPTPDFHTDVAPVLRDFCSACHNSKDAEEGFSVETYAELLKGGDNGVMLKPGDVKSRLLEVMRGSKPAMPPKKEPQPSANDIRTIERWITAGAPGPKKADVSILTLVTLPDIAITAAPAKNVTAHASAPNGRLSASARHKIIEILPAGKRISAPGKVNHLEFSADGSRLLAASGQTGKSGEALLIDTASGNIIRTLKGEHRDILHAAVFSPNGKWIATAGYDGKTSLFTPDSEKPAQTLKGHNGAVFHLAFSPDSTVLASASADQTIKLWRVADGERLDTLNQPQGEQLRVRFTADSKYILGAGNDRRIRIWDFQSKTTPKINPVLEARFAHESPITELLLDDALGLVISAAGDGSVKSWSLPTLEPVNVWPKDKPASFVARVHGSPHLERFLATGGSHRIENVFASAPKTASTPSTGASTSAKPTGDTVVTRQPPIASKDAAAEENEPNNAPADKAIAKVPVPGTIRGNMNEPGDVDLHRFSAKAGERITLEIHAARAGSPLKSKLDSRIQVLHADGSPVERAALQAVRSSWLTFRGKDANTSDDFRVQHFREMELNEFLYCDGEIVKLWMYPRGPDSGFMVYPGQGTRHTYFDTTAVSHPLGAPAYVVRPLPPGTVPPPNGLPVFKLLYENDDDARRTGGKDSVLHFTAPKDAEYLVRVSDTRDFGGKDHGYELRLRPTVEDFSVTLASGSTPTISPGSGREFMLKADRLDEFEGPITVEFTDLPPGFTALSPITIEAGQTIAYGAIYAAADAAEPTKENAAGSKMIVTAQTRQGLVRHESKAFGEIKRGTAAKVTVEILPDEGTPVIRNEPGQPLEIAIKPGQTITAKVRATRHDFKDRIELGKEDSGRNLPHGTYVDNLGLNGLLVVEGETERQFFLTAPRWVPETVRPIFFRAKGDGGQTTRPILLHVKRSSN